MVLTMKVGQERNFAVVVLLFIVTFVINTIAELVRRRFRRAYAEQL